jgi:hypothetical protein
MTTVIDGTAGVTFPSGSGTQAAQSKVLQVVQASYSTTISNSTTSYSSTGLTASITPLFSTSKILILINHACCRKTPGNTENAINIKLQKNASDLLQIGSSIAYTGTAIYLYTTLNFQYLDSPATTSSTTYSTTFANQVASASVSVQSDGSSSPSTITLMEIAA